MVFSANFSRVLRSTRLFKGRGENWRPRERKYAGAIKLSQSTIIEANFQRYKQSAKFLLILSYEPKHRLRIPNNESLIRRNGKEEEGFLAFIRNSIVIFARVLVIGSVVVGLTITYLITRFTHGQVFPIILRKSIEFLGPIFIKFGQWASTRKDLFPENICCTLSQLQRTASQHSWMYTKQTLRAIYGSNWKNVFVKFEDQAPIGSGCCAQVYKAWVDPHVIVHATQTPRIPVFVQIAEYLKFGPFIRLVDRMSSDNDESEQDEIRDRILQPVAVKILHPGIKEQLRRDLTIMRGICRCATYIVPGLRWLSLTDCIDEFSETMKNQVDMNLEAANLIRFSKNFSEKKDVIFPCPYINFTQREVLVESFHEGSPISNYLQYDDTKLQEKLAKIGIKTMLKMVFQDNFVHCDLHPGNILVETNYEPDGKIGAWLRRVIGRSSLVNNPRLIILDCGLVVSLNDRCRRNLKDVFRSVAMGNGELAAEYILKHSSHASFDPDGFKTTIKDIVNFHLHNQVNANASTVVAELFSAMIKHRVKQDGSFSSVILSMVVIEGLGRSLKADIDIFAEVIPFLFTNTLNDD